MTAQAQPRMTAEEYLALERKADLELPTLGCRLALAEVYDGVA